jgi:hypothetical protein
VGFGATSVLFGLILLVGSIALFLLDKFKPELHRESDNIYAIFGVICSVFMMTGALNPNHGIDVAVVQMLLVGCSIAMMWQNVQSRTSTPLSKSGRRGAGNRAGNNRIDTSADNQYRPYRATMEERQELEPARGGRKSSRSLDRDRDYDDYAETSKRKRLPEANASAYPETEDWQTAEPQANEENYRDRDRGRQRNRRSQSADSEWESKESEQSSRPAKDDDLANRRRRRSTRKSGTGEGSMSGYVDYEPVDGNADGTY